MLSIFAAITQNNAIGKENKLLFHMPEDLKRLKAITTGHTVIMGRKTFESIGKVLPNRKNVVLSKEHNLKIEDEEVEVVQDISQLQKYIQSKEEVFVLGGGEIYKILLPYTDKMYLTKIYQEIEADTFFPKINQEEWELIETEVGIKDQYDYFIYQRKR